MADIPNKLYMKCCPLANTLPDSEGDTLLRRDVKKIFLNKKNINFDWGHTNNFLDGVEIKEEYINNADESLQGAIVPAGSWMQVLTITNMDLIEKLWQEPNSWGVSLRNELGEEYAIFDPQPNNNGRLPYNDITDKQVLQPSSIGFTQQPANGLYAEIMTPAEYTAKDKRKNNTGEKMTENPEKIMESKDETEVGFLRGLIKNLYTAKEVGTTSTQPVNQVPFNPDFDAEEFIKSTIEFNKAMPQQNKLIEKLIEQQQAQIEAMTTLTTQITEMKVSISEQNSKIQGLGDQLQVVKAGDGETEIKDTLTTTPAEEETETTTEATTPAEEETEEPEQEQEQESEKPETEEEAPAPTNAEKPEEDEEEEKPPRAPHTAKDAFHRVGTNQGVDSRKQVLTFLSNRGYENFLEQ